MRPSTPEASTALLSPPPLRLLPGGAIQFPGGSYLPLWTSALSRRTVMGMLSQQPLNSDSASVACMEVAHEDDVVPIIGWAL